MGSGQAWSKSTSQDFTAMRNNPSNSSMMSYSHQTSKLLNEEAEPPLQQTHPFHPTINSIYTSLQLLTPRPRKKAPLWFDAHQCLSTNQLSLTEVKSITPPFKMKRTLPYLPAKTCNLLNREKKAYPHNFILLEGKEPARMVWQTIITRTYFRSIRSRRNVNLWPQKTRQSKP